MEKDHFLWLTNRLYQLTLLFPKKEPLRYKIRELAIEIFANLILLSLPKYNPHSKLKEEISKNLEILDSYFELAKNQKLTSPWEIFKIQKEYNRIREELKKKGEKEEKGEMVEKGRGEEKGIFYFKVSERQKKILEILKEKEKVQVWQVQEFFPQVSKRTLRRDFKQLLKQGVIERIGKRNETFYKIK
jgi:Fic family protein